MERNLYIDASHPNETRVVLKSEENIEDYEYESKKNILVRSNIYLGKVSRVEPSLQAAFVDIGRERHGFLAFNDIQPDYYQIPQGDIRDLKQKEEELTALKTGPKPKKIEEKKLAKLKNSLITELRKINLIQIKKEENTLTKLEEIDFNNLFTQVNFEKNLDDAKKIEEVINKVFAPLDLESKIALTKILLKDAIKPEIRKKNETSNNKFNNQLLFLERLLDHVGIDYTKKNIDEKN